MSNWINLEIKGKKYYLLCKINEKNYWDCLLYNGNESWYENQSMEIILARAKVHNRRINFDEDTIKETLQSAQPTEVAWIEDEDAIDDDGSGSLKLKYHVKGCPFNFTWHFNKQSEHDFQKFILFPLFRIVQGLTRQNKELLEVIRKKDVEIKQYKFEFGLLRRVTVSTLPFDAANFNERYAETSELSKCMMQISDLLKSQYSEMKTPLKAKAVDRIDNNEATKREEDVKLTPRRKRRKIIEEQQRVIVEKIQAYNKPFAYESSQSQVSTISQSETEFPKTSKRLLRSPRKSAELKIVNDLDETPTKRARTEKSSSDQLPVRSTRRSLNAGIEYGDSSDDGVIPFKSPNKNRTQVAKTTNISENANDKQADPSPPTSSRAVRSTSPAKLSKTSADDDSFSATSNICRKISCIYDYNESSDDGIKVAEPSSKNLSQATERTTCSKIDESPTGRNRLSSTLSNDAKSAAKSVSGKLATKTLCIEYEDSSESAAEENDNNKTIRTLNATPTKNSNSKITQSNEKLSDDVQNLIDEWKALEKRRLADLKIRQK